MQSSENVKRKCIAFVRALAINFIGIYPVLSVILLLVASISVARPRGKHTDFHSAAGAARSSKMENPRNNLFSRSESLDTTSAQFIRILVRGFSNFIRICQQPHRMRRRQLLSLPPFINHIRSELIILGFHCLPTGLSRSTVSRKKPTANSNVHKTEKSQQRRHPMSETQAEINAHKHQRKKNQLSLSGRIFFFIVAAQPRGFKIHSFCEH